MVTIDVLIACALPGRFTAQRRLVSGGPPVTLLAWSLLLTTSVVAAEDEFITLTAKESQGYHCVAFSPSGRSVAAAGGEVSGRHGHLTQWDLESGEVIARKDDFPIQCGSLQFSPDGRLLAVACGDRSIHVFQRQDKRGEGDWKQVARLPRKRHPYDRNIMPDVLRFSPNGERLVCSVYEDLGLGGVTGSGVQIWSTTGDFSAPEASIQPLERIVTVLRFLDDGDRLLICEPAHDAPRLRIVDVPTGRMERVLPLTAARYGSQPAADVSANYKHIAAGGDGFLVLLDAETLEITHRMAEHKPRFLCEGVSFSPDGTLLASCGTHHVRIWDVASGRLLSTRKQFMVRSVQFSRDGKRLATLGEVKDGLRLWDVSRLLAAASNEEGETSEKPKEAKAAPPAKKPAMPSPASEPDEELLALLDGEPDAILPATTVEELQEALQKALKLPVILDDEWLRKAKISGKTEIEVPLGSKSLGEALDLSLQAIKADYYFRRDGLLITSRAQGSSDKHLLTRDYDLSGADAAFLEGVLLAIQKQTPTALWTMIDGEGGDVHLDEKTSTLRVTQTFRIQEKIRRLLSQKLGKAVPFTPVKPDKPKSLPGL